MIKVRLSRLNISPRKVRTIVNILKGKSAEEAEFQLLFSKKRAAKPILKLLRSAIDIAEKQKKLKKEDLIISNIIVNEGPKMKRYRAGPMGRPRLIIKRTSHIELTLNTKKENGA